MNLTSYRRLILSSAAALSVVVPTAVDAQELPAKPASQEQSGDEQDKNAQDNGGLKDIVVTAQKRSENLQRVPIAVTAITAETLTTAGVLTTRDLEAVTPGLSLGHTGTAQITYLRGVGQSSATPGGESPIATYLDGIYMGSPSVSLLNLANIDQVAVLRGPQGTLFGRNATGGLIQVTTKRPSFTGVTGNAEVGYGNFRTASAKAYLTGPLAPNLAAAASFTWQKNYDGYIQNITTGTELGKDRSLAAQAKLVWKPGSNTEVTGSFFYTEFAGAGGSIFSVYPGALGADGVTLGKNNYTTASRVDPTSTARSIIGSVKIEHETGWAKISDQVSLVDFKGFSSLNALGIPGRPNPNNASELRSTFPSKIKTFTNELQIQSPEGSNITWLAGLFYLYEQTNLDLNIYLDDTFASRVQSTLKTNSYSAFAQATKSLFTGTRLTLGLRYSEDQRHFEGIDSLGRSPASLGLPANKSFPKLTWRVALDQDLAKNVLGYVSYNRGFKSGNFNNSSFTNPPYNPEVIDAYEAGIKSELFDRSLRLNIGGFYYDYKGMQQKSYKDRTSVFIFNAASAEIYGVDIDFEASLLKGLTLRGGGEFLHARYTNLKNGPMSFANPVTAIPAGCSGTTNATIGGATVLQCDLTGNSLIHAPNFSGNINLTYQKEFDFGKMIFNVGDAYSSSYFFEADNVLKQNAFHNVTASLGWRAPNDRVSVRAWVVNLANEVIYSEARANLNWVYVPGQPRTYGVTLGVSF